ncbi:MAG TPA: T9SS type A sorting domain-containing protein [Puia sp.]|nr:T9SS type A sorting domain-containing protein [Puia sp.]
MTYDTVLTSIDGNEVYTYNVPYFPVSNLTLYAVTIRSIINVQSGMTLTNISSGTLTASAQWQRTDDISSAPTGDFYNTLNPSAFKATNLAAGASKVFAPTMIISNNTALVDSVNTADGSLVAGDYEGTGYITFQYTTTSTLSLLPSPTKVDSSASSFADQMHFMVTYYYCNPGNLATDILNFTAVKQDNGTVLLAWSSANEQPHRDYKIQVSTDGFNFTDYASVASEPVNSSANYTYSYPVDPTAAGKLYFRLRIVDEIGPPHYSIVCIIDLDHGVSVRSGFFIYPNPPTDFVNLNLPGGSPQPWQVDIIAADGSLIQRNRITNTNTPRVDFVRRLSGGTYFVRAFDPRNGTRYSASFIVQ